MPEAQGGGFFSPSLSAGLDILVMTYLWQRIYVCVCVCVAASTCVYLHSYVCINV